MNSRVLLAALTSLFACGGGEDIVAPTTGSVEITTTTSGETSGSGYTVSLDGGTGQAIGLNGTLELSDIDRGAHTVQLSGLPEGCTVTGENPRSVTVAAGETSAIDFAVTCVPPAGAIRVVTATTGAAPEGYELMLDGVSQGLIGSTAARTLEGIPAGTHAVGLSAFPTNCQLEGSNPQSVSVTAGATAEAGFALTCTTPPIAAGSIDIAVSTSGSDLDPDGYRVAVDGAAPQVIGLNGRILLTNVPIGSHTVLLEGVAANCTVAGENPRAVTVVPEQTVTTSFEIGCAAPAPPIAFASNGVGIQSVFLVNPDGTGLRELTEGRTPVWSPDGRKLLVVIEDDLYAIGADGSNSTPLVTGEYGITHYRWSPDGSMIACVILRLVGEDLFEDLWVMRADGTGKLRLAENAISPTWSPDGARLAYVSTAMLIDMHLRAVDVDGNGDRRITSEGLRAFQPAWSPDGSRIAFVSIGDKDLYLINPDGGNLVNTTNGQANDDSPTWSPDGSAIAFVTEPLDQQSESEIALMTRDGGNRTVLTDRPDFDVSPAWSPDGRMIVFHGSEPGNSEIFVMNADGSSVRNVSNRPATHESTPSWAGGGVGTSLRNQASALRTRLRNILR